MNKISWSSEKRKISELNPAPYNPRQLNKKQAEDLSKSLDKFSLAEPVVINLNNTIIGGHSRINILKSQGVSEVDVRVPNRLLDPDEEMELNLRLNKNTGDFNWDDLANLDKDLLLVVGFDPKDLAFNFGTDISDIGGEEGGIQIITKKFMICPHCSGEIDVTKKKKDKKDAE